MAMDVWQLIGFFAMFTGMGLILGMVIKWFWDNAITPRRWPIDIVIVEKRGKETFHIIDKARALKDIKEGVVYYRLKKGKRNIKPIEYGYMCHGEGGRGLVHLYSPNREEYFVTRFETENEMPEDIRAMIKVVPDDNKFWWITSKKFDLQRWQPIMTALAKFAPFIMVAMILAAGVIMIVFAGQNMQAMLSSTSGTMERIAVTNGKIVVLLSKLAGEEVPVEGGPPDSTPTNTNNELLPGIPNPIP